MINLMQGDCLERMQEIPDGSVDMILTDPPYGTIKNLGGTAWGGTNTRTDWDTVIDQGAMLAECNRILRTNGCLALFCQDPYTSQLMTKAHNNIPFSYRYTWLKDSFGNALFAKKAPVNYTEDVCVFFKQHTKHDFEGFHPLRPYAEILFNHVGATKREIFSAMGSQAVCHFMRHGSTQFNLCTADSYDKLCRLYELESQPWFRNYSDLKVCDTAYRSALIQRMTEASPKVFNLPDGTKHKSNVLTYKKDYMGLHPTQKPVALLEDLIKTYTNEGHTVLDFTMGSGSTGVACVNTNRHFIGIELGADYFDIAKKRIESAVT